jgi:hypothetical protein
MNFDFSGLDDTGGQNYINAMRQFYQNVPRQEPIFDLNDPEVKKYQQLAGAAPPSEKIYNDYINAKPKEEDYAPSIGRRLAGFLLGTLSGIGGHPDLAAANTEKIVKGPYNQELEDWKAQGLNLPARAKAEDEAQNRAVLAQKFGITEAAKAKKYQSLDPKAALSLSERFANQNTRANQADQNHTDSMANWRQAQDAREEAAKATHELRMQQLDLQRQRLEDTLQKVQKGSNPTAHDQRASDPTEIMKQTAAAQSLAFQKLEKENPEIFGPIVRRARAAVNSNQAPLSVLDDEDPLTAKLFRSALDSYTQAYMSGRR